jgi:hypothetical protein
MACYGKDGGGKFIYLEFAILVKLTAGHLATTSL